MKIVQLRGAIIFPEIWNTVQIKKKKKKKKKLFSFNYFQSSSAVILTGELHSAVDVMG